MFCHWLGKRFHLGGDTAETGNAGSLSSTLPLTRYACRTDLGPARMDGGVCLRLDYNVEALYRYFALALESKKR